MADVTTYELKTHCSAMLSRASSGKERIIVTRRGKPVAALVPLEDYEALEAMEDARDLADAREAIRAVREGREQTLPLEQVAAELGIELPERSA